MNQRPFTTPAALLLLAITPLLLVVVPCRPRELLADLCTESLGHHTRKVDCMPIGAEYIPMKAKPNTGGTAAGMLCGLALIFIACDLPPRPSNDSAVERAGGKRISAEDIQRKTKVDGHRVYVSVYSHIYHMENEVYDLTNTLSIRNTDTAAGIYILSVKYYDSKGKLIRDYVKNAIMLPPLATLEYIIGIDDVSGGSGANFIVEWMSDRTVTTPVIECVMIGTQSQQGISFISNGHILD